MWKIETPRKSILRLPVCDVKNQNQFLDCIVNYLAFPKDTTFVLEITCHESNA